MDQVLKLIQQELYESLQCKNIDKCDASRRGKYNHIEYLRYEK